MVLLLGKQLGDRWVECNKTLCLQRGRRGRWGARSNRIVVSKVVNRSPISDVENQEAQAGVPVPHGERFLRF